MQNVQLLEKLGIDSKNRQSGEFKTICPKCSSERRNKKDLCLSVNIEEGVYCCHHCEWKGKVFDKPHKVFIKPVPRLEKLNRRALEFFEKDRKISNNTLLVLGITEANEWMPQFEKEVPVICFNYLRNGELVNIKFRGPKKAFKMAKEAELIFYNLDAIKDEKEAVIVEGEIDCLSLHECGIHNVVSVPNGASKGNQRLEYLDNCWEFFEDKKKIILMTDADEAGFSLREELARRLGKERCFKVEFPEDCKDANEVLVKHGKDAVRKAAANIIQYPIEGIVDMEDMIGDVYRLYEHGYPKGAVFNIPGFDQYLSIVPGELTTITGIPGAGKSEFVDLMMIRTAIHHEWNWAVCGFEVQPEIHVTKLAEKYVGKAFGFRKNPFSRMTKEEFEKSIVFIDKFFHFINVDEVDVTIDGIIEKASELVRRKGIKGLLIDPWNYIEQNMPNGMNETQYINICLTKLIKFLKHHGVHGFLVAHPTKMLKDKVTKKYDVPTLYSISGSAHFFNKTHNGICVYRDFETNLIDVYVQKVKHSWLGKLGFASFTYNTDTRQYLSTDIPAKHFHSQFDDD